jgi:hypothetical protein
MAKAPFNGKQLLEAAEAGELTPTQVRQAIKRATELGLYDIARKLTEYLVQANEFAIDGASQELRERVAKGISLLKGLGYHPNRTHQKLNKKGVVITLNDIAVDMEIGDNFRRMMSAGYKDYTTEAIVRDFPEFFSKEAVNASLEKLKKYKKL